MHFELSLVYLCVLFILIIEPDLDVSRDNTVEVFPNLPLSLFIMTMLLV